MKLLKILIYSIWFAGIILMPLSMKGQGFLVEAGVYDYRDDVAREFYLFSPTVLVGYDFYVVNDLRFNVSGGFGFRQFKYHENRHRLFTFPFFIGVMYDLDNKGAKLYPSAGMGFSMLFKNDRNKTMGVSHQSFTYGYHITGALNWRLKKGILFFKCRYNFLMPPPMEEIKLSGIMPMVGFRFVIKSPKANPTCNLMDH